jgi:hypothetical protein
MMFATACSVGRMNKTPPNRLRRLLWLWALISVCWAIFVIAPNWSKKPPEPWVWSEERGNTLPWRMVQHECRDRIAFWPDGTRMDDKDLGPGLNMLIDNPYLIKDDTVPRRPLSDREQWGYDVRKKIADCEYAEWGPNAIREQRQELLGRAFIPPAILFLLGVAIAFVWKHYGETIIRNFLMVPPHIRRGFISLGSTSLLLFHGLHGLATRLTPRRTEVGNLQSWLCQWYRSAH